jgi:hypothetical protein
MVGLNLLRRFWQKQAPEAPGAPAAPFDSHSLLFGSPKSGEKPIAPTSTVAVIGNCIAEGIVDGLSSAKAATSKFRFVAIPLHLRSLQASESLALIAEASHVFVQQLGGIDWPLITSTMAADGKMFPFPSLVLRNLWPFDSDNGYPDEVAQALPEGRIRHFDGALARLRQIEPNKKNRIARYRELDFDLARKIDVTADTQRKFLEQIDRHSDSYIGRFIERNYKDRNLFYNSTHPSAIIFQELCEYCWRKLELPGAPPPFTGIDGWKDWSVPVHPGIARRLGVVWAHEATRYRYCTLGDVTWQEWVEAYVDTFG